MAKTFKLTSPFMRDRGKSHAIEEFQKTLNKRAAARRLGNIVVDGEYGNATQELYRRVAYYLGLAQSSIDKGATPYARSLLRHPSRRNPTQMFRAKRRIKTLDDREVRRAEFIKWANSKVGITERGRNRGPEIDKWQKEFGRWMLGQPYCGAFVGYGLRHVAHVNVPDGMVFTPNILNYARNGTGGFQQGVKSYGEAKVGDIALFKFPGVSNNTCDHTGVVVDVKSDGTVVTVEANTSVGDTGSQDNGDGVAKKTRPRSQFVGLARPIY